LHVITLLDTEGSEGHQSQQTFMLEYYITSMQHVLG